MEALIELACVGAAWLIYGSPSNPRHPAIPTTARILAFAGLIVALVKTALWPTVEVFPFALSGSWAFLAFTVVLAEFELGSKGVCLVMTLGLIAWLALGVSKGL